MKKINVKTILITCMVVLIATARTFASDNHTERQAKLAADIKMYKASVNQDLVTLNQQQEKYKAASKECRMHHSAAEHNAYTQAKADLAKSKSAVRESTSKLMKAHQAHVKDHIAMIHEQRSTLEKTQRNLDKYHAKGDAKALNESEKVMDARAERRELFTRLEHARLDRDKDWWVVNKEMKDTKAKSSLSLHTGDHSGEQSMAK